MIKATQTGGGDYAPSLDRRRYVRVPSAVQLEMRLADTDVPMRLETSDISAGGCYVEMTLTLEVGTRLDIVFWLRQQKITTKGVVVTQHPHFGNGIRFLDMSAEDQDQLNRFVDSQVDAQEIRSSSERIV